MKIKKMELTYSIDVARAIIKDKIKETNVKT